MFSTAPSRRMFGLLRHLRGAYGDLLRRRAAESSRRPPRRGEAAVRARSRRRRSPEACRRGACPARPSARRRGTARAPWWSIGPRHMTGALSSRKKPIDISFSSPRDGRARSSGRPATGPLVDAEHVRDRVAVDVGVEDAGPVAEPRERARRGSPSSVDLPTPPFPLATASDRGSSGVEPRSLRCARETPPRSRVVSAAFSSGLIDVELEARHGFDAVERQQTRAVPALRSSTGAGSPAR